MLHLNNVTETHLRLVTARIMRSIIELMANLLLQGTLQQLQQHIQQQYLWQKPQEMCSQTQHCFIVTGVQLT